MAGEKAESSTVRDVADAAFGGNSPFSVIGLLKGAFSGSKGGGSDEGMQKAITAGLENTAGLYNQSA
jgi:hypothetical protein